MSRPELISFDLCPFVQRSVITLRHKGVDFDVSYIDIADKPDWFLEISPTGKVPLLRDRGEVLFESAVINEYLDETQGAPLMPSAPLVRARHRAWIAFGSDLLGAQYALSCAKTEDAAAAGQQRVRAGLEHVEAAISETGPLFSGETLTLVDAAWAPLFMRQDLLHQRRALGSYDGLPRVARWAEALAALPEVKGSVRSDFVERFLWFLGKNGSVFA